MELSSAVAPDKIVTTDEVLCEYLAGARPSVRTQAGKNVTDLIRVSASWLFLKPGVLTNDRHFEEGFLPLSKGPISPTGEPMLNGPSCPPSSEPTAPAMLPAKGAEPIPATRQSPGASRPINDHYGSGDSDEGVKPARYLAPPLEMPSAKP